jgi:hypothetical protein
MGARSPSSLNVSRGVWFQDFAASRVPEGRDLTLRASCGMDVTVFDGFLELSAAAGV